MFLLFVPLALGAILLSGVATVKTVKTIAGALREIEPGIYAKASVVTAGVVAWTWTTMRKVRNVYTRFGLRMVVTSLRDSHENKPGSRHNTGEAFDVSVRDESGAFIPVERQEELANAVATELGAKLVYRGFYKGPGVEIISHPTEKEDPSKVVRHIHVEREP